MAWMTPSLRIRPFPHTTVLPFWFRSFYVKGYGHRYRIPKIGVRWAPSLGTWDGVADRIKHDPSLFVTTPKNLIVLSQRCGHNWGTLKIGVRWRPALWDGPFLTNRPSQHTLPCRIWLLSVKRYEQTLYGDRLEPGKQFLASRISRSLKVIGTNMDFMITFHSNHGPIWHHFQDIARYWRKMGFFSPPNPI